MDTYLSLPARLRHAFLEKLQSMGLEIRKTQPESARRLRYFLKRFHIDVVLDVGANIGQYGRQLRALGYGGQIYSFEPGGEAFEKLDRLAARDPAWTPLRLALGSTEGTVTLNVSEASDFSSIRKVRDETLNLDGHARIRVREQVSCRRLDTVLTELPVGGGLLLKLDVQGFEDEVLAGAGAALDGIDAIEIELSATPLYEGQRLMEEQIQYLRSRGFELYDLWDGFRNRNTGQVMEFEALFFREKRTK